MKLTESIETKKNYVIAVSEGEYSDLLEVLDNADFKDANIEKKADRLYRDLQNVG